MATYKAGNGAQYGDGMAQKLGETLESLGDNFTPGQVVQKARAKKSPIHDLFEWDDLIAGTKFRLHQARLHTNSLRTVIIKGDMQTDTKSYHSTVFIKEGKAVGRAYTSMAVIRQDPVLSAQVIEKALLELNGWKSRYEEYQGIFGDIFEEIDKASDKVSREKSKKPAKKRKQSKRELVAV